MTEIVHDQLSQSLPGKEEKQSAWLIHGEEMLVEKCCRQVSDHLLGDADRNLHYEVVDGLPENVPDLLEKLNTFSLIGGLKLVHYKDASLFDTRSKQARLVDRIQKAWQADQRQKAAKAFFSLCLQVGADPARDMKARDMKAPGIEPLTTALGSEAVDTLLQVCREQGWTASQGGDPVEVLRGAIEKGFPSGHLLIISVAGKVPKKLKFYKTIANHGVVVDCSVPQSERRADKQAREQILRRVMEEMLGTAEKRLGPGLFDRLCQLTGFDLRIFTRNIEKLIDYTGPRDEITTRDVQAVLQRTKQDPIYELTNAVADRNPVQALFYLDSLLAADFHPLQLMAALANQIRKLLVAKDFSQSEHGRSWSAALLYPQFQQTVLPDIQAFDEQTAAQARSWAAEQATFKPKEAGDLRLAAKGGSAYPVFQTLLKSAKYSLRELERAMQLLGRADLAMKTSAQDPVLILKKVVEDICRKA